MPVFAGWEMLCTAKPHQLRRQVAYPQHLQAKDHVTNCAVRRMNLGPLFFFLLKVFIYIHFPFYPVFNRTFRGVKQMRQKPQSLQLISLLWIDTWLTKHNISVFQKVVFSSSYGSPCIPFTPEEIYSRCWWIFWRCACTSLVQTRHQKYEGMDSWEGRLALLLAACFEAVGDRWVACCCWCFLQDQSAQCGPKYQ